MKKSYQNFKNKQAEIKEKEEIESNMKNAKETFEWKKTVAKESNSLWRKKSQ